MTITVKNLVLTKSKGRFVASNKGYKLSFNFDDEWNYKAKVVRFLTEHGHKDVLLDGTNECIIPDSVVQRPGTIKVGVYNDTMATGLIALDIEESVLTVAPGKEIDVPQQVLDRVLSCANICNDILKECQKIREEVINND